MKIATVLRVVVASLCFISMALGQIAAETPDAQSLIKLLTDQPRDTWIATGTIEATHQVYGAPRVTDPAKIDVAIDAAVREYEQDGSKAELTPERQEMKLEAIPFNVRYRLANQYSMNTREVVKYDGDRFHWEITINSREDSIEPEAALVDNDLTEEFDRRGNDHRIFAWDGREYTTCSVSGGYAMVDAAGRLPRGVTGPLTAGLIPWGNGRFSYDSLSAADVMLNQTALTNKASVAMTIDYPDGVSVALILDSSKNYAVTSAMLTRETGLVVGYAYSGYQVYAGQWVPSVVQIERKNDRIDSRAPTSELWTFTSIRTSTPSLSSFKVALDMDSMVEYASPVTPSSTLYVNSFEVDTDELLSERLAYAAARNSRSQNCATIALQHVASAFGKSVPRDVLAGLVGAGGGTNLYDLKQSARKLGLYGRVVKTDLAGLRNLGTAKAILHLPRQNHFVVLDRVDGQNVWLVDLSNRKFYYRQSVHSFPLDWPEGTALLLSEQPVVAQAPELRDAELKTMMGGAGRACNTIIQEWDYIFCDWIPYELCAGSFTFYLERWGCGDAPEGTCSWSRMPFIQDSPCVPDPIDDCTITYEWFYRYGWACN